jgi:hypothetical protein
MDDMESASSSVTFRDYATLAYTQIPRILSFIGQGRTQMTTTEAREIFNQAIASTTDADAIARIEIAREYFTNPDFRRALADHLWESRAA